MMDPAYLFHHKLLWGYGHQGNLFQHRKFNPILIMCFTYTKHRQAFAQHFYLGVEEGGGRGIRSSNAVMCRTDWNTLIMCCLLWVVSILSNCLPATFTPTSKKPIQCYYRYNIIITIFMKYQDPWGIQMQRFPVFDCYSYSPFLGWWRSFIKFSFT